MHTDLLDLLLPAARAPRAVSHWYDAAILVCVGVLLLLLRALEARQQSRRHARETLTCQHLTCRTRHPRSAMRTVRQRGQAASWCPAHDVGAPGSGVVLEAA